MCGRRLLPAAAKRGGSSPMTSWPSPRCSTCFSNSFRRRPGQVTNHAHSFACTTILLCVPNGNAALDRRRSGEQESIRQRARSHGQMNPRSFVRQSCNRAGGGKKGDICLAVVCAQQAVPSYPNLQPFVLSARPFFPVRCWISTPTKNLDRSLQAPDNPVPLCPHFAS